MGFLGISFYCMITSLAVSRASLAARAVLPTFPDQGSGCGMLRITHSPPLWWCGFGASPLLGLHLCAVASGFVICLFWDGLMYALCSTSGLCPICSCPNVSESSLLQGSRISVLSKYVFFLSCDLFRIFSVLACFPWTIWIVYLVRPEGHMCCLFHFSPVEGVVFCSAPGCSQVGMPRFHDPHLQNPGLWHQCEVLPLKCLS